MPGDISKYENIQGILHSYIQRQNDIKNEITLFNPFYETVGSVRQNLSMGQIHPDEFQHDSDISLIIADSLNQYFGKVPMVEFKDRLLNFAVRRKKVVYLYYQIWVLIFLKCSIEN